MAIYYLETSALLKRYRSEQGTDTINELFRGKRPDEVFVTSYFTTLEIEAVAARALKARLLTRAGYRALIGRFVGDLGESILVQPVSNAVVSESIDMARRHALRAGDAMQLATALRVGQAAWTRMVFISSDKELLKAAPTEGFQDLDPQEAGSTAFLKQLRSES